VSGLPAMAVAVLLLAPLVATAGPPEYRVARTTTVRKSLLTGGAEPWEGASPIRWGPRAYETAFRALWDEDALYLRWEATDPSPWHTMTKRDDHIWEEEVVEIFIDLDGSGHDYYELEISPANVVCDLRMISPWPDPKGDIDWDLEGLQTRVHSLTDSEGATTGWTATAFLPWAGLGDLPSARGIAVPPAPGDAWRFNVFRIKRPGGPREPAKDAVFAAWSPPAGRSFHDAGAFRPLRFEGAP
jgi:hypothetical protein